MWTVAMRVDLGMNKTGSKANVKCLKCAGFISYPSLLRLQNGEEIWVKDAH